MPHSMSHTFHKSRKLAIEKHKDNCVQSFKMSEATYTKQSRCTATIEDETS